MTMKASGRDFVIAMLLAAATAAIYRPVLYHQFVNYDDPVYVMENREVLGGLTRAGAAWAFSTTEGANWFPLTWLSHMTDVTLFGVSSGAHHAVNVVLHVITTVLLFGFLRRMTGSRWSSLFVAFVFALHPLHVESVAWVSERKDVLSALFWMSTLWAYARYAERITVARYLLVVLSFSLALMSKPMVVTLPFVLLLLDIWPLRRIPLDTTPASADAEAEPRQHDVTRLLKRIPGRILLEKVPLLVLSVIVSGITVMAQRSGGALAPLEITPFGNRVANAFISYLAYLWSFLWPLKLAVFYPHPLSPSAWLVAVAALAIIAVSLWVWHLAGKRPYLAVGWFWYLLTSLPTIGLIQVGAQARADRYTYIPMIGISIMIAWTLDSYIRRSPLAKGLLIPVVAWGLACLVMTSRQIRYWHDSESLFRHAIEATTDNYVAYNNLGVTLSEHGRNREALECFAEAIRIRPGFAAAHNSMAKVYLDENNPGEAVGHIAEAIRLDPRLVSAQVNMTSALRMLGRIDEAVSTGQNGVRQWPESSDLRLELGVALSAQGRMDEALVQELEAVRLAPDGFDGHYNLGVVLATVGRMGEAAAQFAEAVRLNPQSADAHFNLGTARAAQDRMDDAIREFSAAVRLKPDFWNARNNLAGALASVGRLDEAIAEFSELARLRPGVQEVEDNLKLAIALRSETKEPKR